MLSFASSLALLGVHKLFKLLLDRNVWRHFIMYLWSVIDFFFWNCVVVAFYNIFLEGYKKIGMMVLKA
jgi:hypothetical protein